jgi:predicted SprT family Zn-dependent metalloprotease
MTESKKYYRDLLKKYLPDVSLDFISDILVSEKIHIIIHKSRKSKRGDYRSPAITGSHIITLNEDLNIYSFLFTFLHEYAHMLVWKKFKNSRQPHGKKWRLVFRNLLYYSVDKNFFPDDVKEAIKYNIIERPEFSGNYKTKIDQALDKYNKDKDLIRVLNLTEGSIFRLKNGREFRLIEKIRTRYKCTDLNNHKTYLVCGRAEAIVVNQ